MSIRLLPVVVCDGCGTVIDFDYHLRLIPENQKIIRQDPTRPPERNFCCEACESWWLAQFPLEGPWGPAWDEREWWCQETGACGERAHVRTAHVESPLVDTKVHFEDPEKL
jgi:hypothetical protein